MEVLNTSNLPLWALQGELKQRSRLSTTESRRHALTVPRAFNSFWTSRQRAGHSLHEISYRACFKPQLPGYFIEHLTREGDAVLDCFMGRGTTVLEAALRGRVAWGNDVNPIGRMLVEPRLDPPEESALQARLKSINWSFRGNLAEDLLVFFHPDTLRRLYALRKYLADRVRSGSLDRVDQWIRMIALNRLTGHSKGFFSVYTLPPNQAVTVEAQRRINARRGQEPEYRDVPALILKKSKSLLRHLKEQRPHPASGWEPPLVGGAGRKDGRDRVRFH